MEPGLPYPAVGLSYKVGDIPEDIKVKGGLWGTDLGSYKYGLGIYEVRVRHIAR